MKDLRAMSDVFIFPKPEASLEFTGERYVSSINGPIQHEHHHRYLVAAQYCRGKDVLDIACGEGYGSALIAQMACSVVGADVDAETVAFAQNAYGGDGLRFICCDAVNIDLPDASVDVVVSFETIEHFSDHDGFMLEVRRVLRPNGLFIVSSPNRAVYTEQDGHHNEFHLKEMDREEFRSVLRANFRCVALWEQRAVTGSVMLLEGERGQSLESYETQDHHQYQREDGLSSTYYFIALASDAELPTRRDSLLIDKPLVLDLYSRIDQAQVEITRVSGERDERAEEVAKLKPFEATANRLEAQASQLVAQVESLQREISQIKSSGTFRIGLKLTNVARSIPGAYRIKRYVKGAYWLLTLQLLARLRERRWLRLIGDSGYFDAEWYKATYPDISRSHSDPLMHFLRIGEREGRDPGPNFSVKVYRTKFPNLRDDQNALLDAICNCRVDAGSPLRAPRHLQTHAYELHAIHLESVACPQLLLVLDARENCDAIALQLSAFLSDSALAVTEIVALVDENSELAVAGLQQYVCLGSVEDALNELAARSFADIICYVQNFVIPAPGMAASLLHTLLSRHELAMVAPKLLDLRTGHIVSAGCMSTGDGIQYLGEGRSGEDYEYSSYTEVDYLLPFVFAIRKSALVEAGGLDGNTTDLAESLGNLVGRWRRRNWYIGCQRQGLAYLDASKAPTVVVNSATAATLARTPARKPKILFIDAITPTPDKDSGSSDIVNFMRIFIEFGYEVTFLPSMSLAPVERYTDDLRALGVISVSSPTIVVPEIFIQRHASEFNVIFAYRGPVAARFIDLIRDVAPRAKLILDVVDLHYLREERQAEVEGSPQILADAQRTKQIEKAVIRKVDATIVLSELERQIIAEFAPQAKTFLIPIVRDVPGRQETDADRAGILFVGGFSHAPNVDAISWFVAEVWPKVREKLANAKLTIVGSNVTAAVSLLASLGDGIHVAGHVRDLTPLMASSMLSVAPLRYGAGIKGKVVSSLCYGLPCVATSVAVEGMGIGEKDGVIVADDPEAMANAIVALHEQPELWNEHSDGGVAFAADNFSIERIREHLKELLSQMNLPLPNT